MCTHGCRVGVFGVCSPLGPSGLPSAWPDVSVHHKTLVYKTLPFGGPDPTEVGPQDPESTSAQLWAQF